MQNILPTDHSFEPTVPNVQPVSADSMYLYNNGKQKSSGKYFRCKATGCKDGAPHAPRRCIAFANLSFQDKEQVVRKGKWCYLCLRHKLGLECYAARKKVQLCRVSGCTKMHHTLLHRAADPEIVSVLGAEGSEDSGFVDFRTGASAGHNDHKDTVIVEDFLNNKCFLAGQLEAVEVGLESTASLEGSVRGQDLSGGQSAHLQDMKDAEDKRKRTARDIKVKSEAVEVGLESTASPEGSVRGQDLSGGQSAHLQDMEVAEDARGRTVRDDKVRLLTVEDVKVRRAEVLALYLPFKLAARARRIELERQREISAGKKTVEDAVLSSVVPQGDKSLAGQDLSNGQSAQPGDIERTVSSTRLSHRGTSLLQDKGSLIHKMGSPVEMCKGGVYFL